MEYLCGTSWVMQLYLHILAHLDFAWSILSRFLKDSLVYCIFSKKKFPHRIYLYIRKLYLLLCFMSNMISKPCYILACDESIWLIITLTANHSMIIKLSFQNMRYNRRWDMRRANDVGTYKCTDCSKLIISGSSSYNACGVICNRWSKSLVVRCRFRSGDSSDAKRETLILCTLMIFDK